MTSKIYPSVRRLLSLVCAIPLLLSACAPLSADKANPGASMTVSQLRFIGEQRVPLKQQFSGTSIGGLSGIDYDARRGDWVMISDDRSEINPARYYRARLDYDDQAFRAITFTDVITLRQPDGSVYPSKENYAVNHAGVVSDLEALRVDPRDGSIWYASEGDVALRLKPLVRHAAADGSYRAELPLPPLFEVDSAHRFGPRNNQAFEGIAFTPDGNSLWAALEGPMYQDGELPGPSVGALNRITRFSRDGAVQGQYVYPLSALPAMPAPGKYADNGVSEILALGDTRLLALERSAVQDAAGAYHVYVRLYEIDSAGATDVQQLPTLRGAEFRPVSKRLVLDLNSLQLPKIDNLEGMALGPRLSNGNLSLVLVSDDNFSKSQVTQLLLFEVLQ
ncbi:MAG: phytase [Massilia sp.]|nr:phytase [Massilia sp.]